MAGGAEGEILQDAPCLGNRHVVLPDMGAVAAGLHGQVRAVVQQQGHAPVLHDRPQHIDRAAQIVLRPVLQPELDGGHLSRIQRCRQGVAELGGNERRWGDQV